MKFLITGAYGFVGTNLCKYLTDNGHVCDALDIPTAKRDGVPYAQMFTWDELDEAGDSRSARLNLASYDCVVHLAGKAHDLKKVASEQSYFDINVGLTQRIFERLSQAVAVVEREKPLTFIYFSSSKASADGNAYGRSKLQAEEWLASQSASAGRITTVILRPAMIHGPGNKGNLNLLWGLARHGIPWPLAAFENQRSFTSIGNICAAVEALAAKKPTESSTFFVADDTPLSTNRLIELIAQACGRRAKLWRLPKGMMRLAAKVGDGLKLPLNSERLGKLTEDSIVDNSALKAALGWAKMPVEAEAGMMATLKSFLSAN